MIVVEGIERQVPKARQGALSLSTHMLIELLKREWQRPEPKYDYDPIFNDVSPKAVIIILFWTLFEHLMDRFLDAALSRLPQKVHLDLLTRYSSIGSRVTDLYLLLFDTTFERDLVDLDYGSLSSHIKEVHLRRNEFVHGNPGAVDRALIERVIEKLPVFQTAWLAIYNRRCTGHPNAPPVWETSRSRKKRQ